MWHKKNQLYSYIIFCVILMGSYLVNFHGLIRPTMLNKKLQNKANLVCFYGLLCQHIRYINRSRWIVRQKQSFQENTLWKKTKKKTTNITIPALECQWNRVRLFFRHNNTSFFAPFSRLIKYLATFNFSYKTYPSFSVINLRYFFDMIGGDCFSGKSFNLRYRYIQQLG